MTALGKCQAGRRVVWRAGTLRMEALVLEHLRDGTTRVAPIVGTRLLTEQRWHSSDTVELVPGRAVQGSHLGELTAQLREAGAGRDIHLPLT